MGTLISVASQVAPSSSVYNTSKTLSGSNATVAVPIFRITGSMRFTKLYGIVTTVLGSNHTGSFFRINDQTAQVEITSSTLPTALSSAAAGTMIAKTGLAALIATVKTSAAGRLTEALSAALPVNSEFEVTKKSGANTDIEYVYTTTETPTTGAIQFFVEAQPISADGVVTAL